MQRTWVTLALFALSTSPLLAQAATFAKIPFPCAGAGNATYTVSGPPKLGTTMQIVYTGPNHGGGFGFERPIFLLGLGMVGPLRVPTQDLIPAACFQTTTMEWALWMPGARRYQDTVSLPIPNDATLRGFPFYVQWLLYTSRWDVNPPRAWFEASEVGKAVVGD